MKITILSRREALEYKPEGDAYCFSIYSTGDISIYNDNFKGIIPMWADDISLEIEIMAREQEGLELHAMRAREMNSFEYFLKSDYIKEIDEVVIHCDAGISRSSAIAIMVHKILRVDYTHVYSRYFPNVYMLYLIFDKYGVEESDLRYIEYRESLEEDSNKEEIILEF